MHNLISTALITLFLGGASLISIAAQHTAELLRPKIPVSFSLTKGARKEFRLQLKEDEFAELISLASDDLELEFDIFDPSGKPIKSGDSYTDVALFVAPTAGEYRIVVKIAEDSKLTGNQKIWLEFNNAFKLPDGTKQKDIRRVNGYDVRIMTAPGSKGEDAKSIVIIEKAGKLKKILRHFGGEHVAQAGFYFADDVTKADTAAKKRSASLVANTLDKSGDGTPDVMINYFSGGGHCCEITYFMNLGKTVEDLDVVEAEAEPIIATEKNPRGGLSFELSDTEYDCWNLPKIMLLFAGGKLRPDIERMRKPVPSLAELKSRARAARELLDSKPYLGDGILGDGCTPYKDDAKVQTTFWSEMLDLMISGNKELAWQYFDLVWPAEKKGKELFLEHLKEKLSYSEHWRTILDDGKSNQ